MLNMLKTSLGRQGLDDDPDEGVKDLIDMTLRKLDRDKDGKVSFKVCPIFFKQKKKKKIKIVKYSSGNFFSGLVNNRNR